MNKLLLLHLPTINGFPFKFFTIATLYLFTHKNTRPPRNRVKFSDVAVGFILSNLKRMLLHHARLILGAKNQVEMLENDLRLFKAFLRDSANKGKRNDILNELVMEIRGIVSEGEDVIDAFVDQAGEGRDRSFLQKLGFGGSIKRVRIAKKVESVRIKVKGIYNKVSTIDFATLQIGSLNQEVKTEQIESLREKVSFLQEFIEDFDQQRSEITENLESKIEDAAHAVEDVIETKMVDHILGEYEAPLWGSTLFCQKIEELLEEFDSIKKVVMKIKSGEAINDQLSRNFYHASSSRLPPVGKITMVGFDEELVQVMDELTGHQPNRKIFPIVGMGGIGKHPIILPSEIWDMPLIRHIEIKEAILPDPLMGVRNQIDNRYLENLQTLSTIRNFRCEENVLKRIPNLKKLEITCEVMSVCGLLQPYYLNNLSNLHKLESLRLIAYNEMELGNHVFPPSMKKLNLSWCMLPWNDMTIIGSLPNLEVLKLKSRAFIGEE